MKIGPGVSELWGSKMPSSIVKAHGLYNSLYYRTSRDMAVLPKTIFIILMQSAQEKKQ